MHTSRHLEHVTRRPIRSAVVGVALSTLVLAACAAGDAEPSPAPSATEPPTSAAETAPDTTVASPPDELFAAACAGNLEVATVGKVAAGAGAELSGIVASRANPGVYWVQNDSGAGPEIHAITEDGLLRATFDLGTDAIDWEDIAIGPRSDGDGWTVYVGDIGDNDEARPAVQVYGVREPQVDPSGSGSGASGAEPVTGVASVTLTYPDRAHNAEAMVVDPDTGQLVIITKEITGPAQVFVADGASLVDGASVVLSPAGAVDFGEGGIASWVTGADVAPDGSVIAVRTYGGVHLFARTADQSVADALATAPCTGPTPLEVQGEAVAISADGRSYLTVSEGPEALVHRTS